MNEMYVISVLMLYTLIILINTLLNTYRLLTTTEMVEEKEFIYQPKSSYKLILKNGEAQNSNYTYKERNC